LSRSQNWQTLRESELWQRPKAVKVRLVWLPFSAEKFWLARPDLDDIPEECHRSRATEWRHPEGNRNENSIWSLR
jgi:hypothetical protein